MYTHQQHQGKNIHSSSRMPIPSERQMFLQTGNGSGDSGLVLSTDAKPRLKWTPDLHARFIEAVQQLGGADMQNLYCRGNSKNGNETHRDSGSYLISSEEPSPAINSGAATDERLRENNGTHMNSLNLAPQSNNKDLYISEALHMQIEEQRRLNEQLEVQRLLQLRIEAQGKYLQAVLEKAQETLGRQNLGAVGLEATKLQLSELVSKVSSQCLNSAFSDRLKEIQGFSPHQQTQTNQPNTNDCSMDSCLTSCEGSQKEQEIQNGGMSLRPFNVHTFMERKEVIEGPNLNNLPNTDLNWCDPVKKNTFLTPLSMHADKRSPSNLSMSIGLEGETENGSTIRTESVKPVADKVSQDYGLPSNYFAASKLDLTTEDNKDTKTSCKQLDLNGFSWN
ncbi:Myb-related protein 2 [Glycine max]|nr:Myb-related protein 2 [Glycine max]